MQTVYCHSRAWNWRLIRQIQESPMERKVNIHFNRLNCPQRTHHHILNCSYALAAVVEQQLYHRSPHIHTHTPWDGFCERIKNAYGIREKIERKREKVKFHATRVQCLALRHLVFLGSNEEALASRIYLSGIWNRTDIHTVSYVQFFLGVAPKQRGKQQNITFIWHVVRYCLFTWKIVYWCV